jgi:hypothetical protein
MQEMIKKDAERCLSGHTPDESKDASLSNFKRALNDAFSMRNGIGDQLLLSS